MRKLANTAVDAETIGRTGREELMLTLNPAEVDALVKVLNPLLEEIRQMTPRDRAGAEPELSVTVEDWPA